MARGTWLLLVVVGSLIAGCPRARTTEKAPPPCEQLGQQCQLEPGKLGACSYKADCSGAGCLYCQSQH